MKIKFSYLVICSILFTLGCPYEKEHPPTVTIDSPTDNSIVSGIVLVKGRAIDNIDGFARMWVELWVDGTDTGIEQEIEDGGGDFEISWDTTLHEDDIHTITVRAYARREEIMSESDVITVTINNQNS
ncbi:MAG: hypothetical protein KAK01_02690 [Candidatus Marinimicrobia bacterium]|nr:hypothetical protein [Candidatus Neomarinimicrobiota bacterium]